MTTTINGLGPISIANEQFIGIHGDMLVLMKSKNRMTPQEAFVHGVWLIQMAADQLGFDTDALMDTFIDVLGEVRS